VRFDPIAATSVDLGAVGEIRRQLLHHNPNVVGNDRNSVIDVERLSRDASKLDESSGEQATCVTTISSDLECLLLMVQQITEDFSLFRRQVWDIGTKDGSISPGYEFAT